MKASIIVPTYNACERLYNNLLSLSIQDCSRDDFEVIVVDNGSSDETWEMASGFHADYKLKLVRLKENKGRAFARNCGIDNAEGELLIFHDSDMIAERDYISKHIAYHEHQDKLIVSGQNWMRIFTYFYRGFKGYLSENLKEQLPKYGWTDMRALKDKQRLLPVDVIQQGNCREYAIILPATYRIELELVEKFGKTLEGYQFPWCMFVTSNCSVKKTEVKGVGGFDEHYKNWGCEDLDLGYRLYKNGCRFIKDMDIVSYHQEHPINFKQDGLENIYYFTDKYKDIDLLMFYYGYYALVSKQQANVIMSELYELMREEQMGWAIELYKRLLLFLRDRNNLELANKENYIAQLKYLKQYITDNEVKINMLLRTLKEERLYDASADFLTVLLRSVKSSAIRL